MKRIIFLSIVTIVSVIKLQAQAVGYWTNNGPVQFPINVSGQVDGMGRVCQIKFHPTDSQKMYAVSASGGLYISYNNGYTWTVTSGTEKMPTTPCSSVCVDYTNDNIIYLSTGDPNYYNNYYGIYKSVNGGVSFSAANTNIGNAMAVEILMDPTNTSNLVAATTNGIWKTTNAAANWASKQTGAFKDMKAKPGSKTTLYAVTATQFYYSTDFGNTWTNTSITVPTGNDGLRIAVSKADTNVVYLITTKGYGQILKSTNSGVSFSNIYSSTTQCIVCYDSVVTSGSQGDYNIDMNVNPTNANELLVASHCIWRSVDGGLSWSKRTAWYYQMHTDMHFVEFNPYNPRQIFDANDGGVWMSTDSIKTTWVPRSTGLSSTEIYHAAQHPTVRDMISIGTQDNGELYYDGQWKCNRGGDWGARCAFDYRANDIIWYLQSGNYRSLSPLGGDVSYHSPFPGVTNNSAITFLPNMTDVAFLGKDTVWRSTNISAGTPTWTSIYGSTETIQSMTTCPKDSNILYVVTKSSHILRSDNALAASPTFTVLSTPASTTNVGHVACSNTDTNMVYVSCGSKLYISRDKGVTWTNISGTLPATNILGVIHDNYSTVERIFVSSGTNVYYKDSTTSTWTACAGLPSVASFSDFMVYNDGTAASVLRVSTYGRGVWETGINNDKKPIVDFSADKVFVCVGDTVTFTTKGYGNITTYNWSLPGGTPSSSGVANPKIVYSTPGVYTVTLIASNASGADTVIKTTYITVSKGLASPLSEGFESKVPPSNWQMISQSGLNWQQASSGGFGTSGHSAMFDNFNNDVGGVHDKLITPVTNLDTVNIAYATFDVAYSYYTGLYDSLVVKASTDCGKTWQTAYVKDGTVLATAPSTSVLFVPTSSQWRNDTVNLHAFVGNSVLLSFENVGHFGNALYIDNVNMHYKNTLSVNTLINNADIQLYPNPSNGLVSIKGNSVNGNSVAISCYNIVGSIVAEQTVQLYNNGFNTSLNLSQLPRGMYNVRIQTNDGNSVVKKLVIQ